MTKMDGKVVVVTGAAGGLGRAAALRFAGEGARLAITDIQRGALDKTAEMARAKGAAVIELVGDIT
jgi:NAD(P)-dependent dehydrogenase (short-subunit alcohol dehydrogenase family)